LELPQHHLRIYNYHYLHHHLVLELHQEAFLHFLLILHLYLPLLQDSELLQSLLLMTPLKNYQIYNYLLNQAKKK
jgi:hypothetical protein